MSDEEYYDDYPNHYPYVHPDDGHNHSRVAVTQLIRKEKLKRQPNKLHYAGVSITFHDSLNQMQGAWMKWDDVFVSITNIQEWRKSEIYKDAYYTEYRETEDGRWKLNSSIV